MAKDINLSSQQWCDIVFESKNKAYGAYEIRLSSSKRHVLAFILVLVFVAFIMALPKLIESTSLVNTETSQNLGGEVTLTTVDDNLKNKQEILQQEAITPPPPQIISTVQFAEPVMVSADDIGDEERLASQTTLLATNLRVSFETIVGNVDVGVGLETVSIHQKIAEDETFYVGGIEKDPGFPGGEAELMRFIHENLRYPVISAQNGVEGLVTVRFVVSKTGEVTNVEVLRGLDDACNKEAVRVVQSMQKWEPGEQNGVPVNVYFTLPIRYKLERR